MTDQKTAGGKTRVIRLDQRPGAIEIQNRVPDSADDPRKSGDPVQY